MSENDLPEEYFVDAGEGDALKKVRERLDHLVHLLESDHRVRDAVSKLGVDLTEFDRIVAESKSAAGSKPADSAILQVSVAKMGADPVTVTILIAVGKYVVAPAAVYALKTVWDNFILPELKRSFKEFEPTRKRKR
jgi:hypothetical protein